MDEGQGKIFTTLASMSSLENTEPEKPKYNRKEKSLGILCTNFLSLYNRDGVEYIGLDDAIKRLGVERRRIYDIVNVFESIGVLEKKAKNEYYWKGFAGIPKVLNQLKEEALKGEKSLCIFNNNNSAKVFEDDEDEKSLDLNTDSSQENSDMNQKLEALAARSIFAKPLSSSYMGLSNPFYSRRDLPKPLPSSSGDNRRTDKSLKLLTQNFVKLLLCSDTKLVSLSEAAKILLGDTNSTGTLGNNAAKVRRLYDIANVLSSMNLIEKTQDLDRKRPVFRWLGVSENPNLTSPTAKKRAFGTEITNTDFKRNKVEPSINQNLILKTQMTNKCKGLEDEESEGAKEKQKQKEPNEHSQDVGETENKIAKGVQGVKNLASSYRPSYHNQALHDLFSHFVDAWKTWYSEIEQK